MRYSTSLLSMVGGAALVACSGGNGQKSEPTGGSSQTLSIDDSDDACLDAFDDGDSEVRRLRNNEIFHNDHGLHSTYSTAGGHFLDTGNPFFQSLGTNGRSCSSCHTPESGFGLSAKTVQERFERSCGRDPVFRPIDGATNPNADVSTLAAKKQAYSLLLAKGLIRVQLPIPANAQWEVIAVDDPYGNDLSAGVSVFRRPLPATNLKFAPSIMWDGREQTFQSQALDATLTHAQAATPPDDGTLNAIVDFETALYTSQVVAWIGGYTSSEGATGSPQFLSTVPFAIDINRDLTNPVPSGIAVVDKDAMSIFSTWAASDDEDKTAVARGEQIFDEKVFNTPVGPATCTNCHDTPNAGSFSGAVTTKVPFGGSPLVLVSDPKFRTPDLPLYTLRNKSTGQTRQTTDPGMALRSGLWRDVNRFKTPQLRGLAAHAPYFHNGSAATLADVVDHYDTVFSIGFTDQEKSDLVAFLGAL